ncbi:cupin domain-containing protein [Thermovibrio ammonificans]|jgi:quercetin dioxygenase-like cupin family protein|uniref:Cupin 2 conserved barrel domain protein n=1 Tax=Thermovibrio ammonificans (strain DSM 15698 / JCM 12110 / HB-1) TaxID=648996 RepID=E8T694_THEA1|nr:cupin domain-containing protein [Thermovibrio ammonificans]ADU96678.1 Cupin 2 conserved barrel domain protein [Thermovibrio ammonificans HB-1]
MVEKTGITDKEEVFRRLREEGYTNLYVWSDSPGTFYDWHTHPFNEVRWVLSGRITMGTREGVVTLGPGDRLEVPAGTEHWAEVGPEGVTYVCGSKLE